MDNRSGTLQIEHVRSHARGRDGSVTKWGRMSKKQKMNHVADRLAGEGGGQEEAKVWDFQ